MKTDDQIREEAERFDESLPYDENLSTSEYMAMAYFNAYKSAQSCMEAEIDRRANEKVEDLFDWITASSFYQTSEGWFNEAGEGVCSTTKELIDLFDAEKAAVLNLKTSEGENQ